MLTLHFSNRLEPLLDALHEAMRPPASPFAAEQVIVPTAALERRVRLAIAERRGICAQVECGFLAQWLWRLIARLVPGVAAHSPFAPQRLGWRLFEALGDAHVAAAHPRLAAYLQRCDALMRYELALRCAGLYEQYLTYRPDWLQAWDEGRLVAPAGAAWAEDERWQATLWAHVTRALGLAQAPHPAAAFLEAAAALDAGALQAAGLPEQAHLFALPAMPPLYLELLRQLGRHVELHVYVLNPCREYWFDVVDRRRLRYLAAQGRLDLQEEGQRLLAAWGQQAQSQIDLLLEAAGDAVVEDARFVAAQAPSLLARLQDSVLELRDLEPGSVALAAGDRSLELHVCHSLTRELEVLQDRLLALFAGPNPPQPSDILVVTPDLEAAAPLVDAVFGTAPRERAIPYVLSGRARSAVNAPARALLELLALASSRLPASGVYALLQQPIVARRFGLGEGELDAVHDWIDAAAIRWGLDAAQRGAEGLPATARHTLADGLDRLFLGYALPSDAAEPFGTLLPAGDAEGTSALALGAFAAYAERLAALHAALAEPRAPAAWIALLHDTLAAFLQPEGDELDDQREVQAALRELGAQWQEAGLDAPLPAAVVRAALARLLDDPARGGVPTGAVTFSSMASLRALPYRHVCIVGLNDGAFPTAARPAEFDLMAAAPRRGDRQRRTDERNLFLDLLLAAREGVHLSYTGRSVRDNAPLPPSVLVAELLDYLAAATAEAPGDDASLAAARRRLVVEHPLQPFAAAAFEAGTDPRRRSFHAEYAEALRRGLAAPPAAPKVAPSPAAPQAPAPVEEAEDDDGSEAERRAARPFFERPLAPPGPEWREVTLEQLGEFLRHPCRYLLRRRLGLDLAGADEELQDDEPFLPDARGRRALAARLLPPALAGAPPAALRALAAAGVEYPEGALGERLLEHELARLGDFAARLAPALAPPRLPPLAFALDIDLDGEAWRLAGALADVREGGLVRQRYDDLRASDRLAAWLAHLALCAAAPAGVARVTDWHARDGGLRLRGVARPQALLEALLRLYRQGLAEPLHFFPRAAWAFMEHDASWSRAAATWRCTPQMPHGESEDAAYRLALRGRPEPLDEAFEHCARQVFGPLLEHLEPLP